ncbi:MAG: hypothetical protein AAF960_02110 [Bacteroidota bacterium]
MRSVLLFGIALFGTVLLQNCRTIDKIAYSEPKPGAAEFAYWIHRPLHPDNGQAVTFEAEVSDKEGIAKVELIVYEYELFENEDGLPSKRKRLDSQWGLVYDWEYDGVETEAKVSFTFARGFRAFSNIEYIFRVHNAQGEVSERLALFDAGDARWPLDKITLYATTRNPLVKSINLCLFPDVDYQQDWRGFLTDMEGLIFDGFHQNNKIRDKKGHWQFYYTQQEGDGKNISKKFYEEDVFPDFVKQSGIQGIDAYGLMHKEPYGDGTYLKSNIHFLAYNLFTSESYNYGTAIHESAHAIFNLSDEYDQCACFQHPKDANMFKTLKGCQAFNAANGFPIEDCTPLEHLNGKSWFMSEPSVMFQTLEACEAYNDENGHPSGSCEKFKDYDGSIYYRALEGLCIMQDDGDAVVRDFKRTCSRIIDNYYERLIYQEVLSYSANTTETVDNIYGYEPIVLMELLCQDEQLGFRVKGVQQGVPKKNILQKDAIQLDFIESTGETYQLNLPNVGHFHVHRSGNADEVKLVSKVHAVFGIPYSKKLETMICTQHPVAENTQKEVEITRLDMVESLRKAVDVVSKKE